MKRFILLFFLSPVFSFYPQSYSSLTLSEVMFNPESGENEFIEIFNTSTSESLDLRKIKIIYAANSPDIIPDTSSNPILPPQSFAVILEGDYDFKSGIYKTLIPANAVVLKISDYSFGTSGMSNSSDRQITLLGPANDTLAAYIYSADNAKGYSDEKINLNKDNSTANWKNCRSLSGTPGFGNSVSPLNFDLEVSTIKIFPSVPKAGSDVTIRTVIKNNGLLSADGFSAEIYNDADKDSSTSPDELIYRSSLEKLNAGDSVTIESVLSRIQPGKYTVIAKANFQKDENSLNNILIFSFEVSPPAALFNDLVINEIMYAPIQDEPEWVELFNQSNYAVNIKGWRIYDRTSSAVIAKESFVINPDAYIVIARDSSIKEFYSFDSPFAILNLPSLNNTGDAVVIKDSLGYVIDSLFYLPEWGGFGGKSLERINSKDGTNLPGNWGTSANKLKATPGKINSLTPKNFNLKISAFKSLSKYGIEGEEIELVIQVTNNGLSDANNFLLKIYRDINSDSSAQTNEFITAFNGNYLRSKDSVQFNYATKDFTGGINRFIALIDFTPDEDTADNAAFLMLPCVKINEERNDLIINEIMYAPENGEPEWIEIFNRSSKIINLNGYVIADEKDSVRVVKNILNLKPGEYLILSADSTIRKFHKINSELIISSFPSLNNSGDRIILIDSLSRTIDSLEFSSPWGGSKGRSLERLSAAASSTDTLNWVSTVSKYKSTPGYINSVSTKDYDIVLAGLSFSPPYPFFGSNVSVFADVKNNGTKDCTFTIKLFEDVDKDSLPDFLIKEIPGVTLPHYDSTLIDLQFSVDGISSRKDFWAEILLPEDRDTSNNYFYQSVTPGYYPGTVLINEIMYNPANGEPEWIELFNNSKDSVGINNWSLTDVVTTPVQCVLKTGNNIPPNGYIVITKDSSITNYHRIIPSAIVKAALPVLNNDYDGVVLKDERGITIDSVLYHSEGGGGEGRSLERKSVNINSTLPGNWASSADLEMSTPGRINSITEKRFDLAADKLSFNPRFPVTGEKVSLQLLVRNYGSANAENFAVEFYIDSDSNGTADKLADTRLNLNLNSGDSLDVVSAVQVNADDQKTLTAAKIVFADDENPYNNYSEKFLETGYNAGLVKINEVMYSPKDGMPEWIELVNASNEKVNLINWSVSDILPGPAKSYITNSDLIIEPGEFFIAARDTSFYNYYPGTNSKIKIVNFGTLGNTEDGIIVYDFRNAIIDSLSYKSTWGGKNGFSLERFSLSNPTNDSSNWSTSLNAGHSTPGEVNSILSAPGYYRNDLVFNEIMFEPGVGCNEFVEFYNLSPVPINIGGWKMADESGNLSNLSDTAFFIPSKSYFVLAADSSVLSYYKIFDYPYKTILNTTDLGLNNSEEILLLKDLKGNAIDSLHYSSKWHNKNFISTQNISLERINPRLNGNDALNWSSSTAGATPGRQNSIYSEIQKSESKLSVSPNPFSPDNDGFEDFAIINYSLSQATSQVRIKIFDSRGRVVRNLLNNQPSGSQGSIVFNGLNDDGHPLRIGIYIIYLEALNQSSAVLETMKTVVVVARKLN